MEGQKCYWGRVTWRLSLAQPFSHPLITQRRCTRRIEGSCGTHGHRRAGREVLE